MLKYRRIIQDSARRIADAANLTVDEYILDHVEHEPEFTGEMFGRMKQASRVGRVLHASTGPRSLERGMRRN